MWFAPRSIFSSRGAVSSRQRGLRCAAVAFLVCCLGLPASRVGAQDPAAFNDVAARAAAARDAQNPAAAVALYAQAVQMRPDWQEGWWYLGSLRYDANDYAGAVDAFNHLLALAPHAVPAMALRGLCEFETGAYDDALRDLEMAVAHGAANQPQNEQILRTHLAQLLTRAQRFQDALAQYKLLAAERMQDPDLLVGLGLAGMRIPSLTKDVPAQSRPLFQAAGEAGYVLLAGDSQKADGMFAQLFAQYPTTPNLHLYYGFLLFPHDPSLAIEQFQKEVVLNPENTSAHALLAFSLMMSGEYAAAIPEAKRVLAAEPDMELAQLALGRSLGETGDEQGGLELLNKVLATDPDNLEAHLGLASIYALEGRNEDAYRERMVCLRLAK